MRAEYFSQTRTRREQELVLTLKSNTIQMSKLAKVMRAEYFSQRREQGGRWCAPSFAARRCFRFQKKSSKYISKDFKKKELKLQR